MRTTLGLGLCLLLIKANAQTPVSLTYTVKKVADKQYEIVISAKLENGWHLYSQTQPESAIATPTEIKWNKNPLVIVMGKVKEQGKLKKHVDEVLGVEAWQYSNQVEFVQQVFLKGNVKTNITGTITYQVCTDESCLKPKTVNFNIPVQ